MVFYHDTKALVLHSRYEELFKRKGRFVWNYTWWSGVLDLRTLGLNPDLATVLWGWLSSYRFHTLKKSFDSSSADLEIQEKVEWNSTDFRVFAIFSNSGIFFLCRRYLIDFTPVIAGPLFPLLFYILLQDHLKLGSADWITWGRGNLILFYVILCTSLIIAPPVIYRNNWSWVSSVCTCRVQMYHHGYIINEQLTFHL